MRKISESTAAADATELQTFCHCRLYFCTRKSSGRLGSRERIRVSPNCQPSAEAGSGFSSAKAAGSWNHTYFAVPGAGSGRDAAAEAADRRPADRDRTDVEELLDPQERWLRGGTLTLCQFMASFAGL